MRNQCFNLYSRGEKSVIFCIRDLLTRNITDFSPRLYYLVYGAQNTPMKNYVKMPAMESLGKSVFGKEEKTIMKAMLLVIHTVHVH